MNNNVNISSNTNDSANEIKATKFEPTPEYFRQILDRLNEAEHNKALEYGLAAIADFGPRSRHKKTEAIKSLLANKRLYNGATKINHKMQCMIHMLVDLAEYQHDYIRKVLEMKLK